MIIADRRFFILLAYLLTATICYSQSTNTLLVQNWKYAGVEEFGVMKPPDSTMKNDGVQMKADGTFNMIKNGKEINGVWSVSEKTEIIILTDAKTKRSMTYNLKSIDEKTLVIEYQTPDLVRTRYRYEASNE
ncbi:MAG: hypothetical protein H0V61_02360 [Chitinophagales bacterium]|nr:hypothetical protein [Chitinophagales bacterium]